MRNGRGRRARRRHAAAGVADARLAKESSPGPKSSPRAADANANPTSPHPLTPVLDYSQRQALKLQKLAEKKEAKRAEKLAAKKAHKKAAARAEKAAKP